MELPAGYFFPMDIRNYRLMYREVPVGGVTCEIGSYLGRSLCSVADIIRERKLKVHVVDSWGDLYDGSGGPMFWALFIKNAHRFGIIEHLTINVGLSHVMRDQVPHELDLLFIDADHSYEAVSRDLLDYAPKVRQGGIIAGHDYNEVGVKRAVDEYFLRVREYSDLIWRAEQLR